MANQQDFERELRAAVDAFVGEISAIVRQSALDSIRAAIDSNARSAPARRGRPRAAAASAPATAGAPEKGRRGRKLSAESVEAGERLLAHVQSTPGQRLEEIGVALRAPTKGLKRPIARLVASGALRTEGQRRGTRYFPGSGKPARGSKAAGGKNKKAGRRGKQRGGRR